MTPVPALPPYAHLDAEATQCVASTAVRYDVPELLLHSILMKENGRTGKCSVNKDGSKDCGLAQINDKWKDYFEKKGVGYQFIVNDQCTNIQASAYILKTYYNKKEKNWFKAIVSYNIGPYKWTPTRYSIGHKYATDVVSRWWGFQKWVEQNNRNTQVR